MDDFTVGYVLHRLADDPEQLAAFISARLREVLAVEAARGYAWPVKVETFAEAGLATLDHGILVTGDDLGLETKLTIRPGPSMEVDVSATRLSAKPLVPIGKRVFGRLLKALGADEISG